MYCGSSVIFTASLCQLLIVNKIYMKPIARIFVWKHKIQARFLTLCWSLDLFLFKKNPVVVTSITSWVTCDNDEVILEVVIFSSGLVFKKISSETLWVPLKYEMNTGSSDFFVVDGNSKHRHRLQQHILFSVVDGFGQFFQAKGHLWAILPFFGLKWPAWSKEGHA